MTRYKILAFAAGLALAAGLASAAPASANVSHTLTLNGTAVLCLDARTDATYNAGTPGDPVQLWTCNGNSQQYWNFNENVGSYGTITNGYAGLCLDARTDGSYNAGTSGDPVQLWTCNNSPQQKWLPILKETVNGIPYYELVNGYAGLVLDAKNDATNNPTQNGDPVQLWSWRGTTNQLWSY